MSASSMLRNSRLGVRAYSSFEQKIREASETVRSKRDFKEFQIPVPWGHLAARWYEPYDKRPILAVHGWQNNLNVFNRVIPLLDRDVGFLTFDLPGHGHSSRLPLGVYYHFTFFILSIEYVRQYMKWDITSLLGHSMGAMMTGTYTMLYSNRIDLSICVDGFKPIPNSNAFKVMARILPQFCKLNEFARPTAREPPSYTLDLMKRMICTPHGRSVSPEQAHHMMERVIAPSKKHEGKYYFTYDPRIRLGDVLSLSQFETVRAAPRVTCPMCVVKSREGSYYEHKDNWYEVLDIIRNTSRGFEYHYVEGKHHSILNNPESMVPIINKFIRKHYLEGCSKDIVLDW